MWLAAAWKAAASVAEVRRFSSAGAANRVDSRCQGTRAGFDPMSGYFMVRRTCIAGSAPILWTKFRLKFARGNVRQIGRSYCGFRSVIRARKAVSMSKQYVKHLSTFAP